MLNKDQIEEARNGGKPVKMEAAPHTADPGKRRPLFVVDEIDTAQSLICNGYDCIAVNGMGNMPEVLTDIKRDKGLLPLVIMDALPDTWTEQSQALKAAAKTKGAPYYKAGWIDWTYTEEDALTAQKKTVDEQAQDALNAWKWKMLNSFRDRTAEAAGDALKTEMEYRRDHKPPKTFSAALDGLLGGGLYPGLYVLGSQPGAGKTALAMQIADHIADNGTPVFVFSLEMSAAEIAARSISRRSFEDYHNGKTNQKPVKFDEIRAGAWIDDEASPIHGLVEAYKNRGDLYIFGDRNITAEDIETQVEAWRSTAGSAPVVVVDYLQILRPLKDGLTDKQAIDATNAILMRIADNSPVIVISSWSRDSYNTAGGMGSGKESGSIEYSADTQLSLQYSKVIDAAKDKKKTEIPGAVKEALAELKKEADNADADPENAPAVSVIADKSRGAAFPGERIELQFFGAYYCFRERGEFRKMTAKEEAEHKALYQVDDWEAELAKMEKGS